jgi:hypothetical protein
MAWAAAAGLSLPMAARLSWRAPARAQAHRSGLACAAGGEVGVVSASANGTVVLWPEAELRGMSEAAGFVLPGGSGCAPGLADARPLTISDVRPCRWAPAEAVSLPKELH